MYIFISYSSKNTDEATKICDKLENSGQKCFLAYRDIAGGAIYAEELITAIDKSDAVLLLLSEGANTSPHVLREMERACSKGIPIIVYKMEEVVLSKGMEYFLMTHQWVNKDDNDEKLISVLKKIEDKKSGALDRSYHENDIVTVKEAEEKDEHAGNIKNWILYAVIGVLAVAIAVILIITLSKGDNDELLTAQNISTGLTDSAPSKNGNDGNTVVNDGKTAEIDKPDNTGEGNADNNNTAEDDAEGKNTAADGNTADKNDSAEGNTDGKKDIAEGNADDNNTAAEADADSKNDIAEGNTEDKNTTAEGDTEDKNTTAEGDAESKKNAENAKNDSDAGADTGDKKTDKGTASGDSTSDGNNDGKADKTEVKKDKETGKAAEQSNEDKSEDKSVENKDEAPKLSKTVAELAPGECITIGSYRDEPIEWIVLHRNEDGSTILVSKKILCLKMFDAPESGQFGTCTDEEYLNGADPLECNYWTNSKSTTYGPMALIQAYGNNDWSVSNIRCWLNSDKNIVKYEDVAPGEISEYDRWPSYNSEAGFLKNFTEEEKSAMTGYTYDYVNSITGEKKTMNDRVFLLSEEELSWFFEEDVSPIAEIMSSALQDDYEKVCETYGESGYFYWWLRDGSDEAACKNKYVTDDIDALVYEYLSSYYGYGGIRPCICIK